MFVNAVWASFTALLCTSISFVDARTVRRDVVNPPITSPTAGTVWNVNERHNVTWDTSVIPPGTNNTGMIVLGFLDANDPNNEHLDLKNPLAQGFPITVGHAEISVPSVQTRDSYIIVLFGDSGNASPKFTINNISINASPSISTSAFVSTAAASSSVSSASASIISAQPIVSSGGTSAASIPQALPSSVVSGSTAAASAHVASSSAVLISPSSASSSVPTAQTQPAAAQSATSSNAGIRSASYDGAATLISAICSLALVLGFSL